MALYVHPDNQQLLWGIINTNPYMNTIFEKYHPTQKAEWFKSVIETFYKQNQNQELSTVDLHQLNKDTLAYMIQLTQQIPPLSNTHLESNTHSPIYQDRQYPPNLPPTDPIPQQNMYQQPSQQSSSIHQQNMYQPSQQPMHQHQTAPFQQQNMYQQPSQQPMHQQPPSQFGMPPTSFSRQQQNPYPQPMVKKEPTPMEYKSIFEVKKPEPIDFSEKIEDGVITNMDELIQKHLREREQELNLVSPPKLQQNVVDQVDANNMVVDKRENIISVIEPIVETKNEEPLAGVGATMVVGMESIEPKEVNDATLEKKEMDVLKEEILVLKNLIHYLKEDLQKIKDKFETF
jgi:hypothetical protein